MKRTTRNVNSDHWVSPALERPVCHMGFMMVCGFAALCSNSLSATLAIEQPTTVVIELDDSGRYSSSAVAGQFARYLGQDAPEASGPGRCLLTTADRLALVLLDELEWADVSFEKRRITVTFRTAGNRLRKQQRSLLTRWLNVRPDYWSSEYGLVAPRSFVPKPRTIVLLHGLEADSTTLKSFVDACSAHGITAVPFVYPNDGPIAESAKHLSESLKVWKAKYPGLRPVLVGHSMGGLVARYCLETPSLEPGNVAALVTLGTPHHGSALARFHPLLELATHAAQGLDGIGKLFRDGLGEAAADIQPESDFLRRLNRCSRPPTVRYFVAAGSRSFVDTRRRLELRRDLQLGRADTLLKTSSLSARLLRLLDEPELVDGAGDGAVSIKSALLRPNDGERVFRRNHLDLIHVSARGDEVFDWILKMLKWSSDSPVHSR